MWIRSSLLVSCGFVDHGFTTRKGPGVSEGDFAAWNFSTSTGDSAENVEANYQRLSEHLGVARNAIRSVHQIHSQRVVEIDEAVVSTAHEKADGLLSWVSGVVVAVKTADCVPVLIADPVSRAVAAVHAGWRGVVGGIVLEAIQRLRVREPQAQPVVAIGPHICANCFQVGPEVAQEFPGHVRVDSSRPGHFLVDLAGALKEQLRMQGIPLASIEVTGHCTLCDPERRFFSHRGSGGRCGRMINFIRHGGAKEQPMV